MDEQTKTALKEWAEQEGYRVIYDPDYWVFMPKSRKELITATWEWIMAGEP